MLPNQGATHAPWCNAGENHTPGASKRNKGIDISTSAYEKLWIKELFSPNKGGYKTHRRFRDIKDKSDSTFGRQG